MTDFNQLRREKEVILMRESARYSWRETLEEGKYQEGGEVEEKKEKKDEGEHPFVEVLPTEKDPNASEKPKKKEKKEEVKEEKRLSLKPNTNLRTEEMSVADQMALMKKHYEKNPPKKWQPGDREKQRASQMSAAQKKAKPDTRSDSEKMADATDERPGSFYRKMKR